MSSKPLISIPVLNFREMPPPPLSGANEARMYFDSDQNKILISQNGGPYLPLASTGDLGLTAYVDNVVVATDVLGLNFSSDFNITESGGVLTINGNSNTTIGNPEDSYTDGLFKDFIPSTPIGTAIDRFNEVLAALSPPPPAELSSITYTSAIGESGAYSYGPSNTLLPGMNDHPTKDVNDTIGAATGAAEEKGVYGPTITSKTGVIAGTEPADSGIPTPAFPAGAFRDGNIGLLQLFVNGVKVRETNLASFASGSDLNANGSGFTLSAATPVVFPNGVPLNIFSYRTGTWTVGALDQIAGYNDIEIIHTNGVFIRTTNLFSWVNDTDNTATTFSSPSLGALSLTGSRFLSGVEYYTGGSATYSVVINNAYKNTYKPTNAITHASSLNLSLAAENLAALPLLDGAESMTHTLSKTATISAQRILNQSITANTTVARTRTSLNTTGGAASINNILVDNVNLTSTNIVESFDDERYRVASNKLLTDLTGYTSGGSTLWNSTQSLKTGSAGHNDGLLVYNGKLQYPTNTDAGVVNGNFSGIGPVSNDSTKDYSTITGNKVYLRYFFNDTGTPKQQFSLNITSSGTSFVPVSSALSATDVHLEILAPNTTRNSSNVVEFKDAATAFTTNIDIGCLNGTLSPTNWPITLGTQSTATSQNSIVIRITASSAWTGTISNISLTWA